MSEFESQRRRYVFLNGNKVDNLGEQKPSRFLSEMVLAPSLDLG